MTQYVPAGGPWIPAYKCKLANSDSFAVKMTTNHFSLIKMSPLNMKTHIYTHVYILLNELWFGLAKGVFIEFEESIQ